MEPCFLSLDQIDADWALEQAREIVKTYPRFERSNTSGKFFRTYECWHFHKDSDVALIREFVRLCEAHRSRFEAVFNRALEIDFIILGYTADSSREMCIYHKDGFYFDGQMHLTILGNGNIHVLGDSTGDHLLNFPNGQFWYLNSSRYVHKIVPSQGERFELCAAVSYRKDLVKRMMPAVSKDPSRHLELNNPELLAYRKKLIRDQWLATQEGRASSDTVAEFSHDL